MIQENQEETKSQEPKEDKHNQDREIGSRRGRTQSRSQTNQPKKEPKVEMN